MDKTKTVSGIHLAAVALHWLLQAHSKSFHYFLITVNILVKVITPNFCSIRCRCRTNRFSVFAT